MASSVKKMKRKIKSSNYKNSWLLECNGIERSIAEKQMSMRWCLEHGADPSAASSCGSTPLHAATRRVEPHIVHMLIKYKADVNAPDRNGETPLHLAMRCGDGTAHILEPLDPEEVENDRDDVPHLREVRIVDMLLGSADTNRTDNFGDTPLHVAVRSGEASVVYLLLKHNADVNIKNSTGETALHLAAHRGEAPIFEALLRRSTDVNTPNSTDNTPLHLAAHRGQETIVRMLLGSGADVKMTNSDGDTPLHLATRSGKTEVAKLLLEGGAEVNKKNDADFSPLHVAADAGKEEIVKLLLSLDAEVDTPNNAGNTPLHLAVLQGHANIVILLLEHGVNVNIQNSAGDTSLYLAVLHGEPVTVELLLGSGADVDTTSKAGNAPLHVAAYLGKSLIVDLLLNSKADVNKTDSAGNTALHLAARRQQARVVRSLLRHNADVTIRNSDWNTPLTVARVFHFEGNEEIVSLLQNAEKLSDPLALNDDRSQPLSHISQSNHQVAIPDTNLQIDTPFKHLDTDTHSKFPKRTDTSGLAGQLYESKLLCLVLLRALNDEEIENFVLGTNIRGIGDIDDICMRYRVKGQDKPILLFVQAKHREDREKGRVTVEDVQSASGDYSLRKYFDSYLTLKDRFQAADKDPDDLMLEGDLAKIECNLIIYTPGMDCFTKKNTKNKVSAKVDYLINTADQNLLNTKNKSLMIAADTTEVFQYKYDDSDIENLNRMSVIERLKKSGAIFLEKIMAEKENPNIILVDKLIARFHVVMGREVLKPCDKQEANKDYRMWEFRPQFFESNSEYLLALKETFVKELSSKRCDQSKLIKEDQENFKLVVKTPDAATISKLIGKLATYSDKTKKLKHIEVTAFKKKFKTDVYNSLLKQFDEIEIDENVINEAVRLKLEKMKIKLPLSFGNLDMTFRGNNDKIQQRMTAVAVKIVNLLKEYKDQTRPVLEINDENVGPGRMIEQGFIEINGGIGSAVGNLLVFDPVTKMLKFKLDSELPTNAALFSNELTDEKHGLAVEILNSCRIKIDVDGFPKDSLDGDGYGEKMAKEYLSKVWFYTDQAKQDEVEDIIKDGIDKYYNNEKDSQIKFEIHSDAIFRSAHRELQDWWKQSGKVKYLSKKTDLFQKAKLECFNNLLLAVMYHVYESKIYSIDFKFNPLVQQSDTSIQAAAAFDIVFGQKFKIFDKQSKRINTDGSQKIKELVQYAEQLANYYVAASSDPSMIENIFNHPESQGNIVVNIVQNNVEHEFDLKEFQYPKRGGTSAMSGQLYKIKLLCLVHLRAINDYQIKDFFLATSIRDIGDMDDICLRYRVIGQDRPVALFLQAKHKDNGNLTVEDVLNTSGEFSLQKYFKSYLTIRNRFEADEKDCMFQGDFGDLDWNFIIYTPARDTFSKKKTVHDVSEKVHYLISTSYQKKSFQYEYNESDIDTLAKIIVLERLKKLGVVFLEFVIFENDDSKILDKLIAQYHVVMGREVLQPCTEQADNEYRMWEFRPEFFKNDCEYLESLRKTFVIELSTKYWDQSKITKEDEDNFMLVLKDPCASTISKIIGKLAVYNKKTKKLQIVASYRNKLMANDTCKMSTEQFHEIQMNDNVINEAIQMRLEAIKFKLPFSFGNLDMIFSGNETKITEVAKNLKRLLEINIDSKVVNINDIMGTEQDLKDTYSCIESALGNLLVLDPHTKMLKFNLENETLADNAARLLKELKEHKPINEALNSFRFKVSIDQFPKDSFHADEHDKKQVLDFLSRLWFYAEQAKEDEVELILKDEINGYYSNIGRNCSAYCSSLPDLILLSSYDDMQKWWMQTKESPYLTRASELFERAKDTEIGNLLWTVINFMFISKTSSVDIKFKQRVSKYFKFVKMHQIFNKMAGTLFNLFDKQFHDTINIELPVITEPAPYSNYSSLGELVFSLEIHTTLEAMEWVAMKMWAVSTFTQYFLLAKGGPGKSHRPARDGFLLQQLCNGRNGHLIEGERDPDDMYSFITTKFS